MISAERMSAQVKELDYVRVDHAVEGEIAAMLILADEVRLHRESMERCTERIIRALHALKGDRP
jgi:hypothetical protein